MLKNLIFPIVVGLTIFFVQYYLKDVTTATYTVSDAIEIVGSQGKTEYAQEIAVVNSGHTAVKTISIKVPRHLTSYKLTKHSGLVKKEEFLSDENSSELVYPELPTGQKFRLQVRYDGGPIEKNWISISHADGNAQAQDKQLPAINFLWIWLAYALGLAQYLFMDIKEIKKKSFRRWTTGEHIFRNDKPWFASTGEWSEMQFEAIERALERYNYSTTIDQSSYYQLLNHSKPTLLSEEHWVKLQDQAIGQLKSRLSREVTRYSKVANLVDLFKLKKPKALPLEIWTAFQESLNEQIQINLIPTHINAAGFINILEPNSLILKGLPDPLADKIRNSVQKSYSDYLAEGVGLELMGGPLTALKIARFDLLTADQSESLKKRLLRLARIKAMPNSWDFRTLELFISDGRPEWMPEEEFNSLCEFVSQSKALSDERDALNEKKTNLEITKLEVENIKKRVLVQLDLIDRVLMNPNSIDKLEDYDQTFAPGNRKNLELVASLLKSASESNAAEL